MKKLFFTIFVSCLFIPISLAYEKESITVNCDTKENCEITTDDFKIKINSLDLYNSSDSKVGSIENFSINPEYYTEQGSEDYTNAYAGFLALNFDKDLLSSQITSLIEESTFEGYIQLNYELEFYDLYDNSYFLDDLENDLMNVFLDPTSLLLPSETVNSFSTIYEVNVNGTDVDLKYDYSHEYEDGSNMSGTYEILLLSTDYDMDTYVEGTDYNLKIYILMAEINEEDLESMVSSLEESSGEIDITPVTEEPKIENTSVENPDTGIASIVAVVGLLVCGIIVFIWTKSHNLFKKL